ncbi:MAG TPA: hypothetical protein VEI07_24515 [Planctomycetaceae bacterium]|nr:hypothetical protein [Planctomycetaceae bacterium]
MFNAAVFVRRSGAFGLGHVGWAFAIDDTTFDDGSVENPLGTPVTPPSEDGFWECRVCASAFVSPFVPLGYDHYKTLTAPKPTPAVALQTVNWMSTQPYVVIGQNCEDDVYDVLRSFGVANLPPLAWLNLIPNDWFDALPGTAMPVSWGARAWRYGPKVPARKHVVPRITPRPSIEYPAFPPPWRIPGTKEFDEFQREINQPMPHGKRRRATSPKRRRQQARR